MDNYINKQDHGNGNISFDAYWVIHGNPLGWNANGKDFHSYIDFHDGKKPAQYGIPWPTQPGEKLVNSRQILLFMCNPCVGLFKCTVSRLVPSSSMKSHEPDTHTMTCSRLRCEWEPRTAWRTVSQI